MNPTGDAVLLTAGSSLEFDIVADLSASEDAAGEFSGKECRVILKTMAGNAVLDQTFGLPLTILNVQPGSFQNGNWQTIQ